MQNVFIDTDVIMDILTNRQPYAVESARLFSLIDQKIINGYTSSLSFSNLYYVLRKFGSHRKVIRTLQELSEIISILNVDGDMVRLALQSDFKDFEDAIQYFTAQSNAVIDSIVTRNVRDYKGIDLPVMTPETFIITLNRIAD
ncbi:MAG: PIN domain-containing protein [Bacteroidales bacterium]|jgi:predicted nucleic acid-binding protein|nr:PIN domain-containing protein [Bacteroidales bacterium]